MKIRTIDGYADAAHAAFSALAGRDLKRAVEAHNAFMDGLYPLPPKGASKWETAIHFAARPGEWIYLGRAKDSVTVEKIGSRFAVSRHRAPGASSHTSYGSVDEIYAALHRIEGEGSRARSPDTRTYLAKEYHILREALEKARELELRQENQVISEG